MKTNREARDRQFDPWWRAQPASLRRFVAECAEHAEREALRDGRRRRRLQARYRADYGRRVEAVLVDLIRLHLSGGADGIIVDRSNEYLTCRRYRHTLVETKELLRVVEDLEAIGLVVSLAGSGKSKRFLPVAERAAAPPDSATTTRAGPALVEAIRAGGWSAADLVRECGGEVLILKAMKDHPKAKDRLLDYEDDDQTRAMRTEVEAVSDWIATFHLTLDDEGLGTSLRPRSTASA